jgi:hypothetical protein
MFVDELPRMPIIRGYVRAAGGGFSPAHLTIGMYAKTWVRIDPIHNPIQASPINRHPYTPILTV